MASVVSRHVFCPKVCLILAHYGFVFYEISFEFKTLYQELQHPMHAWQAHIMWFGSDRVGEAVPALHPSVY